MQIALENLLTSDFTDVPRIRDCGTNTFVTGFSNYALVLHMLQCHCLLVSWHESCYANCNKVALRSAKSMWCFFFFGHSIAVPSSLLELTCQWNLSYKHLFTSIVKADIEPWEDIKTAVNTSKWCHESGITGLADGLVYTSCIKPTSNWLG